MDAATVYLVAYIFGSKGDPRLMAQPYGDDWNGCRINVVELQQGGRSAEATCVSPAELKKILESGSWGARQEVRIPDRDPFYLYFKM